MTSVEIPTILRSYTGGERTVAATGTTLAQIVDSLEASYPGIADRLVEGDALRRFVNVYLNDEDVRFLMAWRPRSRTMTPSRSFRRLPVAPPLQVRARELES